MAASIEIEQVDPTQLGRVRKPYATPRLVRHGDVRALTQAGSGDLHENNPQNSSCNNEVMKKACTL
jgi:hypothetical protein